MSEARNKLLLNYKIGNIVKRLMTYLIKYLIPPILFNKVAKTRFCLN